MSVLFINRVLNTIVFQNLMDTPNTIFLCSSYADLFMVGIILGNDIHVYTNCHFSRSRSNDNQITTERSEWRNLVKDVSTTLDMTGRVLSRNAIIVSCMSFVTGIYKGNGLCENHSPSLY